MTFILLFQLKIEKHYEMWRYKVLKHAVTKHLQVEFKLVNYKRRVTRGNRITSC